MMRAAQRHRAEILADDRDRNVRISWQLATTCSGIRRAVREPDDRDDRAGVRSAAGHSFLAEM